MATRLNWHAENSRTAIESGPESPLEKRQELFAPVLADLAEASGSEDKDPAWAS